MQKGWKALVLQIVPKQLIFLIQDFTNCKLDNDQDILY